MLACVFDRAVRMRMLVAGKVGEFVSVYEHDRQRVIYLAADSGNLSWSFISCRLVLRCHTAV